MFKSLRRRSKKYRSNSDSNISRAGLEGELLVPDIPHPLPQNERTEDNPPIQQNSTSLFDLRDYTQSEICLCYVHRPLGNMHQPQGRGAQTLYASKTLFKVYICSTTSVFHLIIIRPETNELFMKISLNKAKYRILTQYWHEIESIESGRPRVIVLQFTTESQQSKDSFESFYDSLLEILSRQNTLCDVAVTYGAGYNFEQILENRRHVCTVDNRHTKEPSMKAEDMSRENMETLVSHLSRAINEGQVEEAKTITEQLAAVKANIGIELIPEEIQQEPEISVKIYIEDKDCSGGFVNQIVKPSTTVGMLKKKFEEDFGFPQAIQKWIIGSKMPKDHEMLKSYGVDKAGFTIFLYLVSCRSVGLTKEEFQQQQPQQVSGDYIAMDHHRLENPPQASQPSFGGTPVPRRPPVKPKDKKPHNTPGAPVHPSQSTPAMSSQIPVVLGEETLHDIPRSISSPEPSQQGWPCPMCTFINPPTRPGCEQCTESRPANYQVPEHTQIPSEAVRIERERQLDAQAIANFGGGFDQQAGTRQGTDFATSLNVNLRNLFGSIAVIRRPQDVGERWVMQESEPTEHSESDDENVLAQS